MRKDTKRLTFLALGVALAMILSFVESQIPPLAAVPGVKIGLSNIVTVAMIYIYGWRDAAFISLVRISLSALLFGNAFALIYSFSGAVLSFVTMLIAKRFLPFGIIGVSVIGGVMHNAGQIAAAAIVMENTAISLYMIPLVISGTLAGVAVGVLSGIITYRLRRVVKK